MSPKYKLVLKYKNRQQDREVWNSVLNILLPPEFRCLKPNTILLCSLTDSNILGVLKPVNKAVQIMGYFGFQGLSVKLFGFKLKVAKLFCFK